MIESELVLAILDSTLEGMPHETNLQQQLDFLIEIEYEHMGNGMIVFFENVKGISKYRLNDQQLMELFGESPHELKVVELHNAALKIEAEVSVHFTKGLINRVEIWNTLGDYPEDDLETWELKRIV